MPRAGIRHNRRPPSESGGAAPAISTGYRRVMQPEKQREWTRLAVFMAIGTLNTAVCYVLYAALVALGWHYNLALVIDYLAGTFIGYVLHRGTTFADRGQVRALGKYSLTQVAMFLINLVLLDALVASRLMAPLAAQAVAVIAPTLAVYYVQTYWVFRAPSAPDSDRPSASRPVPTATVDVEHRRAA